MSFSDPNPDKKADVAITYGGITAMSACRLSAAIRERQVSCVEVMQAYLERIHRYNPIYNAMVSMVRDEELMELAQKADLALDKGEYWGWMHGMPHAVKDLASAKGLETSLGSRLFAGTIAGADDLHIARIRSRGAIFHRQNQCPGNSDLGPRPTTMYTVPPETLTIRN